jgi:hypothetical protein
MEMMRARKMARRERWLLMIGLDWIGLDYELTLLFLCS